MAYREVDQISALQVPSKYSPDVLVIAEAARAQQLSAPVPLELPLLTPGAIPPVPTSAIAWLSVQGDDFRGLFKRLHQLPIPQP